MADPNATDPDGMNHAEIFFVAMVVVADVPDVAVVLDVVVDVDVEVGVVAEAGERLLVRSSQPRAAPPKCP